MAPFNEGLLGALVRPVEPRFLNLDPPKELAGTPRARPLDLLRESNAAHPAEHPGDHNPDARIASYELAARMQAAARQSGAATTIHTASACGWRPAVSAAVTCMAGRMNGATRR